MEQSLRADLNHLLSFYWVARTASFTAAARALSLPKSSVSRQIAQLEQRLGTRLIERTTRRLSLTEIGRYFLGHCERVVAEAEDAERTVSAYTAEPRGLLRIGVPVTFARSFLAPLLPGFCQRYPEVQLDLVLRGGRVDPLETLLDVVIHVGQVADSSYTIRRLGSMGLGLYAAPDYVEKRGAPARPADLARHDVITMSRSPRGSRWKLSGPRGATEELALKPRVAVADPVIACELVEAGLGISLLPLFLTRMKPQLVRVLPRWSADDVEFFALFPQRRLAAPKLNAFLDYLREHLQFDGTTARPQSKRAER